MSLRQQLTDHLPALLPASPSEAVKGSELIRLLKLTLGDDYSDASLRYHFSVMSCDPSSPIAKVERGQGYYRRSAGLPLLSGAQEILSMQQGRFLDENTSSEDIDQKLLQVMKFRAVVEKYALSRGHFTFEFRDSLNESVAVGNLWKFPEVVLVDWQQGEVGEDGLTLNRSQLALKQTLGLPPYRLTAGRLRLEAHPNFLREDIFRALSAGLWANGSELLYAAPITDQYLVDQLRFLSSVTGVGITTFGLTPEALDDLPHPAQIRNAMERETEALLGKLKVERIAPTTYKTHCSLDALEDLQRDHPEMTEFLTWLGDCLASGTVRSFTDEDEQ